MISVTEISLCKTNAVKRYAISQKRNGGVLSSRLRSCSSEEYSTGSYCLAHLYLTIFGVLNKTVVIGKTYSTFKLTTHKP